MSFVLRQSFFGKVELNVYKILGFWIKCGVMCVSWCESPDMKIWTKCGVMCVSWCESPDVKSSWYTNARCLVRWLHSWTKIEVMYVMHSCSADIRLMFDLAGCRVISKVFNELNLYCDCSTSSDNTWSFKTHSY